MIDDVQVCFLISSLEAFKTDGATWGEDSKKGGDEYHGGTFYCEYEGYDGGDDGGDDGKDHSKDDSKDPKDHSKDPKDHGDDKKHHDGGDKKY